MKHKIEIYFNISYDNLEQLDGVHKTKPVRQAHQNGRLMIGREIKTKSWNQLSYLIVQFSIWFKEHNNSLKTFLSFNTSLETHHI